MLKYGFPAVYRLDDEQKKEASAVKAASFNSKKIFSIDDIIKKSNDAALKLKVVSVGPSGSASADAV